METKPLPRTPTPWNFYADSEIKIADKDGKEIAFMVQPDDSANEDAAFIVRAVNNHAKLILALENIIQDIDEFGKVSDASIRDAQATLVEAKIV